MSEKEISETVKNNTKALKHFFTDNKALTGYWIVFTSILLFQHTQGWNWDFLVYLMNGEYMFHSGEFMEWLRPPFASFLMGLLQYVFSRTVTGYAYILIVSGIFLYAAKKFSEQREIDNLVFTVLLTTPVFISYATREGTEMLALSFLMLFLAKMDRPESGGWLGLSVLTRWTQGIMLPLILLQRDVRKILKTVTLFASVFIPWILYSYIVAGDPFVSPVSFIGVNLLLGSLTTPPQPVHLLIMTLPSLLALIVIVKKSVREELKASIRENTTSWAMLYVAATTVFIYFASDITHLRYLFQLTLPVAYFGAKAWQRIDREKLIYFLIGINLIFGLQASLEDGYESSAPYQAAAEDINCMAESDSWVPLNYAGLNAESPVDNDTTVKRLEKGWRVLDFTGSVINSKEEREAAQMLRDEGAYMVYGKPGKCAEPIKVDNTRIGEYNTAHGTNYTETRFMIDLLLGKIN